MPTIYINGKSYEVNDKHNLLQQCLSRGIDIPYFCWHPALGSVGACRQCAVTQYKDENDTSGRIIMSCMTAIEDGMRISTQDRESRMFRRRIIEWLMTSHPHDCPVCDEGGECHLQDMTVMTGHTYRRYRFPKRTFTNQNLGPFVNHEMNRCITCYRCVRFYKDYAGGKDLQVFASRNRAYFGRHQDGPLENVFSGNLVEVCPTGVFTDKTLKKHYTRKWDLQSSPSVCMHCASGCNTFAGSRKGMLRRILNRYNSQVNGYFLCDRGRFAYEFVNSEQRIREIYFKEKDGSTEKLSPGIALEKLQAVQSHHIIGIGSPRASIESNFALRTLVGNDNFYAGVSDADFKLVDTIKKILQTGPTSTPTLEDIEQSDAVLILGEDIGSTAPRIALACRQATRQKSFSKAKELNIPLWIDSVVRDAAGDLKSPLFILTPDKTSLDEIAIAKRLAPDDIARLGFAIAHAIDGNAPDVEELSDELYQLSKNIAEALSNAERPLLISGTGCGNEAIIQAASNIVNALFSSKHPHIYFALPECNSMGLTLFNPKPLTAAIEDIKQSASPITAIVIENNLHRRAHTKVVNEFVNAVDQLILIDHVKTASTKYADWILPAASYAESTGTVISAEGRMQRFFSAMEPVNPAMSSWQWISEIFQYSGQSQGPKWQNIDELIKQCAEDCAELKNIIESAPLAKDRIHGMKVPRSPHRFSGRTAMYADHRLHEPQAPQDGNSPLNYSMEGLPEKPPSALISFYWAPGWNSVQASNKYQTEVGGPLLDESQGIRIFQSIENRPAYFTEIPPPFQQRNHEYLFFIALHHVFGSEELSAYSPGIIERSPSPYIAINEADALRLNINSGEQLTVSIENESYVLPCQIKATLPPGIAGLPTGLQQLVGIMLPACGTVKKVN